MACESWSAKLDAYFDGELDGGESRTLQEHLRVCSSCASDALEKLLMKQALRAGGTKFAPDPALRARIRASLSTRQPSPWNLRWLPVLATAVVLIVVGALLVRGRNRLGEQQLMSELADQHVATLASSHPVDVVSTDRHTVKPWFEGKIPFTFNLPELQNSPFTLVGGRVSYLRQAPGAELIFRLRQHQISVFIFQEQSLGSVSAEGRNALSFGVRSWTRDGLRYFLIGDASPPDLDRLSEILQAAG